LEKKLDNLTMQNDIKFKEEYSSRMVGLSDGVFPTDFDELMAFVHDVPPFGICIIFIYWIWNEQNRVFQYYNIFDGKMNFLNMLLLFFVLVYVYPLKFLMKWIFKYFGSVFQGTFREDFGELNAMIPMEKVPLLMVIYSIGFICIFGCLYLMHRHGLSKSDELNLTPIQLLNSNTLKKQLSHTVLIGILSFLCAFIGIITESPISSFFSGIVYNLLWVSSIIIAKKHKRQLAELNAN